MSSLRSIAAETLAASGGGRNQIIKVDSIVIEANRTVSIWDRLLTRQVDNPRLDIQPGVKNQIQEVVIRTKSSVQIPQMRFGDAVFSFQSEWNL